MATIYMFLYTLLISTIFANNGNSDNSNSGNSILRRSDKFLKSKRLQYAVPTNVCYGRVLNGNAKSMKLQCEEDTSCDEEPCGRKMVAYKWNTEECDGNGTRANALDAFLPKDKGNYPYNCYEEEEVNGGTVNPEEFTTPHMIVKLRYADVVNDTNVTNPLTGEVQPQCIARPNNRFYRSFAAITDMCHLAWTVDTPFWYRVHCNTGNETDGSPGEFLLQKFTAYGCPNTSEFIGKDDANITWPVYQQNGCRNQKWLGQYWYTEVVKCTHPKYNLSGVGANNYYYSVSFVVFMIIYMIIN